jgi:hypothetical protein
MVGAIGGAFIAVAVVAGAVRRPRHAPEGAVSEGAADEGAPQSPPVAAAPAPAPAAAPPTAPVIVPVETPPPALPPQEPVNLKRPARVLEPPVRLPTAPALAEAWPVESPQVFPQPQGAAARRPRPAERAAGERPAEPSAVPAEKAAPAPASPAAPAPTATEILARGQTAFDRGNYPEAIRRAKEAVAAGAAVAGHLLVADAYYHLQRYADALREYEATLAIEPSNALARRGRELAQRASAGNAGR